MIKYLIASLSIFLLVFASLGLNERRRKRAATKKDYLLYFLSLFFFVVVVFNKGVRELGASIW